MKTGFKTSTQAAGANSDMGDLFIPRTLFSDGGLWTWGNAFFGQLGNNTGTATSSPIQTISAGTNWKTLFSGRQHVTAIKNDGTLWTWGNNNFGQLGDNTITPKSSPIQTISGGTNWKLISAGYYHTLAIKTDGTLWAWGTNSQGQLGNNTIAHKSSPIQTIAGGSNWKSVSCGVFHTAAVKVDSTLWIWGYNPSGQLGDNTIAHKSSPVQTIAGGSNWKLVTGGMYHTAAIKTDGTLWLWGKNNYGQLGDNTITPKSSPIQTISGGTNWKLVASGFYHTVAIKIDGTLWLWGKNSYGQLGDNNSGGTASKSSPVQTIVGGTNWKSISSNSYQTAAIKTDGTLWLWGQNNNGQLGDNTLTNKSSPVQTITNGPNWKSVSCGSYSTAAIKDDY
jgi:alpha-tubulin suppressor-like RCC1 family protein